jgi:hypothetical protein
MDAEEALIPGDLFSNEMGLLLRFHAAGVSRRFFVLAYSLTVKYNAHCRAASLQAQGAH